MQFPRMMLPGTGFAFTFDGKAVGPTFGKDWKTEVAENGLKIMMRHTSGLVVERTVRTFPVGDAVEYSVVFRNTGKEELPALSQINSLDVSFKTSPGMVATTCGGGQCSQKFPPKAETDFTLTRTVLDNKTPSILLSTIRGRSSFTALPFFYLQDAEEKCGMFVGIGWTGQWQAAINFDPADNTVHITGGIQDAEIRLRPGEEISVPKILLGSWNGNMDDGSNTLRRLIRDHYAPDVGGKKLVPPMLYTTWFQICAELDENMAKALIDRAAEMGQEFFEVDAGWYEGTPTTPHDRMDLTWKAISESMGDWESADSKRFPSGLKALADYTRKRGMQFGLWFEPERAGPDSRMAKEHPDWVMTIEGRRWVAVDLGIPEVQDFIFNLLDRHVRDLDLRYIRWDMNNHDLLPYWATRDVPGRKGMTQIRYVDGLHRIEDRLRKAHPNVILENCAGGGLRVDFTELGRRHTIWVSDAIDTEFVRYHLEGLSKFLVGSPQLVALSIPEPKLREPGFAISDYDCQVCFAGAFGLSGRIHEWPQAVCDTVRKNAEIYKQLRGFLDKDYYPLLHQPRTNETWAGWQFHDPEKENGFIQVFRDRSPEQKRAFPLKGIKSETVYQFTDPYTNESFKLPGKQALAEGIPFDLPEQTSRVLIYCPATK